MGGHTLQRHIGRTDAELEKRLERERHISAASTYTDRATAEHVVAEDIRQNQGRIQRWLQRSGGHPNLVLDYHGDEQIGRVLNRGESHSVPCSNAVVVLKWAESEILRSHQLSGVQMSERKTHATVSRNDYPKLSEFLRGYLHQDAAEEYDSADEAAEEFLGDADSDEKATLQKEVRKFLQWSERQSLAVQNSTLKALGSCWTFDNPAEVTRFLQTLLGNHPKHDEEEED